MNFAVDSGRTALIERNRPDTPREERESGAS